MHTMLLAACPCRDASNIRDESRVCMFEVMTLRKPVWVITSNSVGNVKAYAGRDAWARVCVMCVRACMRKHTLFVGVLLETSV